MFFLHTIIFLRFQNFVPTESELTPKMHLLLMFGDFWGFGRIGIVRQVHRLLAVHHIYKTFLFKPRFSLLTEIRSNFLQTTVQ